MNKRYCAFGAVGFTRLGEVINELESYIVILPEGYRKMEYWDKRNVKIFSTKEQAELEVKYWEDFKDNR